MDLTNKFRKLRKEEGFTLIELIVTVAIIAVLSGVGVPAYSGYVEKANKGADQSLAGEVVHALSLHYYRNNGQGAGYVALSTEGATADPEFGAPAMVAAFGEGWENSLKLKYDGWEIDNALLNSALDSSNPGAVGNSTYLNSSNVPELLGNVQTVTAAAAGLLGTVAKTPTDYVNSLNSALGSGYMDKAVSAGIMAKGEDGTYSFVDAPESGNMNVSGDLQSQLSNLMVFSVADELEHASNEDMTLLMMGENPDTTKYSPAAMMAAQYALYKAVSLESGLTEDFDAMNAALSSANSLSDAQNALASFNDKYIDTEIMEYCLNNEGNASDIFSNDADALSTIMQGVTAVSPDYSSGDVLKDGNLYTSGAVADDVNDYVAATSLAAGLDETQIAALKGLNLSEGYLISITPDGKTQAIPAIS